jgi:hypothetical protein
MTFSSRLFARLDVHRADQLANLAALALGAFGLRVPVVLFEGLFDRELVPAFGAFELVIGHRLFLLFD